MRYLGAALSACLAACGDNSAPPPDAAPDAGPFSAAPHAPLPTMFPHARNVLANVELVTLTYDGYASRAQVEAFGDRIVHSDWYTTVGAEYGVAAGKQVETGTLGPLPSSLSRSDIRDAVNRLIATQAVPSSADPASGLLYLVYVPPGVTFVDPAGVRSYHEVMTLDGGVRVPIAVVFDSGAGLTGATVSAAHQLIDAVTDPFEAPSDGYYTDPPNTDPWTLVVGEVADLCEGEDPITVDGYAVPRVYSNRAAAAGSSPCIPFVPDASWCDVSSLPSQMPTVVRGGTATFILTGWSTDDGPDWRLRTRGAERSQLTVIQLQPELSSGSINNRGTVKLTLHVPPDANSGSVGGVYVLSGTKNRPWPVGVIVQ